MATNGVHEEVNTIDGYDYVVVGSGAGGGPVAANLAKAGYKVLLLEAGDDQGDNINYQVPIFHLNASEDDKMSWDFYVKHHEDQKYAQQDSKFCWDAPDGTMYIGQTPPAGSKPKGIWYPRAGTLGGCTAHNAMITIYPHESDWSNLALLTGDSSWEPKSMRKYLERLERAEYLDEKEPGHGYNGWLGVNYADVKLVLGDLKILSVIAAAAATFGDAIKTWLPDKLAQLVGVLTKDVNSIERTRDGYQGLYQIPLAMSNQGKRNGTRDLLVKTMQSHPLHIRTGCLATRVIFEEGSDEHGFPKAIGIEFLEGKSLYKADPRANASTRTSTKHRVLVSREVILAGGAFNTPQLLKLSGVGPRDELEKFSIPVVKHLPGVGTNLQDRYEIPVISKISKDFSIIKNCTLGKGNDPGLEKWKKQEGPYLSNGLIFGTVKKSSYSDVDPDLFIFGGPLQFRGYYPGYSQAAAEDHKHWTWAVLKAHSHNGTGTVRLASADPCDVPAINFNYFPETEALDSERDLSACVEGIQFARKIMDDVFELVTGDVEESWPGREVESAQQIKDFVKKESWGHHASCTCPIGRDGDPNAVLDSRFRVRGVNKLRVVDASVFPRIPGFFPVLSVYMISEKASDVIIEDARLPN